MARTMSVPCRRDLACYRNDGHAGDHAYATPDTVPSPAPNWQAGCDAGYREAQEDIAAAERPRTVPTVALMTRALRAWDDQATETQAEIVLAALAAEKAASK